MQTSITEDMVLNGELCHECGVFLDQTPAGRPQRCEDCERRHCRQLEFASLPRVVRRPRLGNRRA